MGLVTTSWQSASQWQTFFILRGSHPDCVTTHTPEIRVRMRSQHPRNWDARLADC